MALECRESVSYLGQKADLLALQDHKDNVFLGAKLRQICWQSSVKDSGSSAMTQTYCVCTILWVPPYQSSGTWGTRGTNATMKFMLPAVQWVIKSFVSDPEVVYLLPTSMKIRQTNLSACK